MYQTDIYHIPIIKRKIQPIKNKYILFNYLIQNLQLKILVEYMNKLIKIFEQYDSKIILYQYDSILFDLKKLQFKQILQKVKNLTFQYIKYKIHFKFGYDFDNMKEIKIMGE